MRNQRTLSLEFKRRVVEGFLSGESRPALSFCFSCPYCFPRRSNLLPAFGKFKTFQRTNLKHTIILAVNGVMWKRHKSSKRVIELD
ncbi:hypothetical protein ES703_86774 [subsurface metagenome]